MQNTLTKDSWEWRKQSMINELSELERCKPLPNSDDWNGDWINEIKQIKNFIKSYGTSSKNSSS